MKTTVVPAQVTTVEDRIAGNLGLSQILLLSAPVFGGSMLFVVLPPSFKSALYKLIIIITLFVVCGLLAIRVRGRILLQWITLLARYYARPRYYVFDKRSMAGRTLPQAVSEVEATDTEASSLKTAKRKPSLSTMHLVELQELLANPSANITFESQKGGLNVRITEIKQEG